MQTEPSEGTVMFYIIYKIGSSLAVQWLGLHASIPGRGIKIPQATQCGQKKKKKERKKEDDGKKKQPYKIT